MSSFRLVLLTLLFVSLVVCTILSPVLVTKAIAEPVTPKPVTAAQVVTTPDGIRWIPMYGLPKGSDQMYFHQESMQIKIIDGNRYVLVKFLDPNPDSNKHESTGYLMTINCHKQHIFWIKKFTFNIAFPGENDKPITGEDNDLTDLKNDMEMSKSTTFFSLFCADTV